MRFGKNDGRKRAAFSFLKTANAADGRFPTPDQLQSAIGKHGKASRGSIRSAQAELGDARIMTLLPIVGSISAGFGESTEPVDMGSIPVDMEALNIKRSSRTFALKVRGESMIGAQIADGDLVIVEAREPKIGEIVAALIDGETTLKRFVTDGGQLFLKAENPAFPDLIPLHELTVQGVVRAVVRVCDRSRGMP